jgi:hypothetical protein
MYHTAALQGCWRLPLRCTMLPQRHTSDCTPRACVSDAVGLGRLGTPTHTHAHTHTHARARARTQSHACARTSVCTRTGGCEGEAEGRRLRVWDCKVCVTVEERDWRERQLRLQCGKPSAHRCNTQRCNTDRCNTHLRIAATRIDATMRRCACRDVPEKAASGRRPTHSPTGARRAWASSPPCGR